MFDYYLGLPCANPALIENPDPTKGTNQVSNKRLSLPRKVFHFLKEAGYGIGNMQAPQFFDDVDEQRGLLIIDVGACHGSDWAVPSAKKRGHTVLAFEPMPANRERFMDTVRNNDMQYRTEIVSLSSLGTAPIWPLHSDGKIFLFAACVSDKVETVQLYAEGELASIYPQNFYPASSLNTGLIWGSFCDFKILSITSLNTIKTCLSN